MIFCGAVPPLPISSRVHGMWTAKAPACRICVPTVPTPAEMGDLASLWPSLLYRRGFLSRTTKRILPSLLRWASGYLHPPSTGPASSPTAGKRNPMGLEFLRPHYSLLQEARHRAAGHHQPLRAAYALVKKYNGWASRELIEFYMNYCKAIFERYKDR